MNLLLKSTMLILLGITLSSPNALSQENEAVLFAPGIINSNGDDYGPAFSPDGNTLYFVKRQNRNGKETIYYSNLNDNVWSKPKIAAFSGEFYDKEPFITVSGNSLYFASKRLVDGKYKDFDIWMVVKNGNGWSTPTNIEAVNSDSYDNYPSVTNDGTIYFSSTRDGTLGENDLYASRVIDGKYSKPENQTSLNSVSSDADPYISPDEDFIIFSSTREGGFGEGDLYISYKRNGVWSSSQNLGKLVNSDDYEYTPTVSLDEKFLFFSRGWGDIYYIQINALEIKIK